MERRMPDRQLSPPEETAIYPRTENRDRPAAGQHGDLEKLQETDAMLRAAIEALSPDVREIRKALARPRDDASSPSRQLDFRLIVTAVILVIAMLLLDILLV